MISKRQFLDSVRHETKVAKHLWERIPEGKLDYSPGENMRTTLELLRYLGMSGIAPAHAVVNNDWTTTKQWDEAAKEMPASEFPQRMDDQATKIEELIAPISDDELRDRQVELPWGVKTNLGAALIDTTLRFMTAYRLQLFCYVKASGAKDLNTYNAWLGIDTPPPKDS